MKRNGKSNSLRAPLWTGWVLLGLSILCGQCVDALANGPAARKFEGQAILARYCSRCHAINKTDQSTLRGAPPVRDIYRRYPLERLEFELSEGIGSTHRDMPQVQFSSEQIEKILNYLDNLIRAE